MRRITLQPLIVTDHALVVRWAVDPPSELYRAERFFLRFPSSVAVRDLPQALLWSAALMCLCPHWVLLRPCRVELPVRLPPGEREFWLRLAHAAQTTLELTFGEGDLDPAIEIDEDGPQLERPVDDRPGRGSALAFSGGKDSLVHLGILRELGERTIAVATTSPWLWGHEHATPRRRAVLASVAAMPEIELVEVRSDLRATWGQNPRPEYDLSVGELTVTFLYLAAAIIVGRARGVERVLLASEAEVQETVLRGGQVVQHPHLMYSAATQQAIDALLAPHGIRHGSLTYPLRSWQVHDLLWSRYPGLRRLQYSCMRMGPGEPACNRCWECLTLAFAALRRGASPAEAEVDLAQTLRGMRRWQARTAAPGDLPADLIRASLHAQTAREIADTPLRSVIAELAGGRARQLASPRVWLAAWDFVSLRRRLVRDGIPAPLPGFRRGYLELIEPRFREPLERIYGETFSSAPADEDAALVANTRSVAAWVSEPLGQPA